MKCYVFEFAYPLLVFVDTRTGYMHPVKHANVSFVSTVYMYVIKHEHCTCKAITMVTSVNYTS